MQMFTIFLNHQIIKKKSLDTDKCKYYSVLLDKGKFQKELWTLFLFFTARSFIASVSWDYCWWRN